MRKINSKAPEILQDLSESALINAIQANRLALHSFSRDWPQADVRDDNEISWCITDIREPFFNCIIRSSIEPDRVDAVINDAISRAKARNVNLWWFISPYSKPPDLGKHLKANGFSRDETIGMALDLTQMKEDIPVSADFRITQVQDIDTLKTWSRIAITGFELHEEVKDDWFKWYSKIGVNEGSPIRHYLGWLHGEPVATSSVLLAEGVAGIYNVSTIPHVRGRGIGFGITIRPLQDTCKMGYRIAILQASKKGLNIYRRIGFKEYCKLTSYIWISGHRG